MWYSATLAFLRQYFIGNIHQHLNLFSNMKAIAAGCATVTDANLDLPEEEQPTFETTTTGGTFWDTRNGDDMDPIVERPTTGGTLED